MGNTFFGSNTAVIHPSAKARKQPRRDPDELTKNQELMNAITGFHNKDGFFMKADFETVKELVIDGATNEMLDDGNVPLIEASGRSNIDIAGFLLSMFHEDINKKNSYGTTAFEQAIMCGKIEIIELLLQKGVSEPWHFFIKSNLPDSTRTQEIFELIENYCPTPKDEDLDNLSNLHHFDVDDLDENIKTRISDAFQDRLRITAHEDRPDMIVTSTESIVTSTEIIV